ncbi:MAG: VacJ family lipoprotein [Deltaproteobacteria bacterium]|nr:VacJ family lipoprotein [Deltaproteobacteria bacterium]MBW2306667.1 VacJ family lipoprotein [Deltaproteobacteria bacterium]
MRSTRGISILFAFMLAAFPGICSAETRFAELPAPGEVEEAIADPLESMNRAFFDFNDKLYFWVLKPVATGYKTIVPQPARIGVRNFFSNLATPIRLVNCLLQANFKGVGTEIVRLVMNTTLGMGGLFDPAKEGLNIEKQEEDFGQTLGFYGAGPAFYINWPILGPSSLRDTVGFVGDLFLDPLNYLVASIPANIGVRSYDRVNETSLTLGDYEDFKDAAIDPYIALRDAYHQYRKNKIKE